MTFRESVHICMGSRYLFKFGGRASRSEFWWFMLFIFLVNFVTSCIGYFLPYMLGASLTLVVSLLFLPPNLGVTVRRLHDRNLSGWWLMLPIGVLVLWILGGGSGQTANPAASILMLGMDLCYLAILCMPGTPGTNKYGPNPVGEREL